MSQINIGIEEQDRKAVVQVLSKILADAYVLYTKTRNYHWNVVGSDFSEYHKMFEEQYNEIDADIDEIAERIRALGQKTPATLAEFSKTTQLEEHPGQYPDAKTMIKNLADDHESVSKAIRKSITIVGDKHHDVGTEDFLTGLLEKHEKTAWMLRSILE
jgi:starvation-inducible DNA-binding protein